MRTGKKWLPFEANSANYDSDYENTLRSDSKGLFLVLEERPVPHVGKKMAAPEGTRVLIECRELQMCSALLAKAVANVSTGTAEDVSSLQEVLCLRSDGPSR